MAGQHSLVHYYRGRHGLVARREPAGLDRRRQLPHYAQGQRPGNQQLGAAVDFIVDRSSPVAQLDDYIAVNSTVTAVSGNVRSSLDALHGTAWDVAGPGGAVGKLDKVLVHIKRPAQGSDALRYWKWNTGTWDAAQTQEAEVYWGTSTIHAPGLAISSWTHSLLPPPAAFTQGYSYILRVRARDTALPQGNTQQTYVLDESSFTMVWDVQPPAASITGYEDGDGNGSVNPGSAWTISGLASDTPAGVDSVANLRVQIGRLEGSTTY